LNGFTVPLLKWFYDVDPSSIPIHESSNSFLGEIIKVFNSQECHKNQVDENKMLKEYVQNLMKSSASLGTDRFGRSIATE
jgi:hypothetical protein